MNEALLNQRLQQLKTLNSAGLDSSSSSPDSGASLTSSAPIVLSRQALPKWALPVFIAFAGLVSYSILKAK